MRKLYTCLVALFFVLLAFFGLWAALDKDPTMSVSENRKLAEKPKLTLSSLFDGSYQTNYETYYADTFPLRESFMSLNRKLNGFYYYSGKGDGDVVLSGIKTDAEQGGVSLDDYAAAVDGEKHDDASASQTPDTGDAAQPDDAAAPDGADEGTQTPPEDEDEGPIPERTYPEEYTSTDSTIIISGDTAMDIPTATYSVIADYAQAINNIDNALSDDVRVFSVLTPNSGEFYSPEDFHTGLHSQKDMIDACYADMQDSVYTVDAYSELARHADEYIFFRTDHHWTALGAYYAYKQFCKTAGFEAVPLDEFQTGRYDNFVGTMYTYTSSYPQSQALKDNPDYVDYYLPIVNTTAKYYQDATLTNGIASSVVITTLSPDYSNKYLCFISGDTPIFIIDTDVKDGGTCLVLKESYGNAFVPFLTSHYSRIIVVDPREFNRQDKPALDLVSFAAEQGVNDVITLDYPFMINNIYYISWLNRLVGMDE